MKWKGEEVVCLFVNEWIEWKVQMSSFKIRIEGIEFEWKEELKMSSFKIKIEGIEFRWGLK